MQQSWIKYAHPDGTALTKEEREEEEEKVIENRIWQCCLLASDQKNCTKGNFDNFARTKKFVEFARNYLNEQKSYKRCLFEDDVRRGALSGSDA